MEVDPFDDPMHDARSNRPAATGSVEVLSSHVLHVRPDRPVDIVFSFEHQQSRVGIGASVVSHLIMGVIAFLVITAAPGVQTVEVPREPPPPGIIWLSEPGPGGGGGGGGDRKPEPPRKAELPGKDRLTVPVQPEPEMQPPKPEPPPPPEDLNIPARTLAAADVPLAGAITNDSASTALGAGAGGGAGTGDGTGIGSGDGSGLGPGRGGGSGGGAYRPGSGVTTPQVLREVKPAYTAEAMRAKVQGTVWVECIVMPDGNVGEARVIRSLDPVFGLDQEALKAARQWKFVPGTRQGVPVPVIIIIELTFTLR
jgi:TonB family protein